MIDHTAETGTLGMGRRSPRRWTELRKFMFARVYTNPVAKGEESKAKDIIRRLFEY